MKTATQTLYLIFALLFTTIAKAQVYYNDEKTGEEYEINQKTHKNIINAFLKEQKATAIEFNTNRSPDFPFRLKNKIGNWVLFHLGHENLYMEKEGRKYSFQFPTSVMEQHGFTFANRRGKTYLVNLYDKEVETKMGFDEVVINTKKETIFTYDKDYNEKEKIAIIIDKIVVRKDNTWGLIELRGDDLFYLSRNFLYNSPEEVPPATGFQVYQLEMMENIRQEYNIDLLIALDENGYYFKGRNKKTKLFGLYVGEGEAFESIPPKYDNIIEHKYTGTYEVWKNNKVGYYNSNFKLVFKPSFDDFEYVHLDYTYGCALKTNGKWELYDAFEPEKLIEGSAASIDELIGLWMDR
ncbi:hypothetical protein [Marixanthomonas ophiurae]|uniref:WG repeat-containing protein n=1 Tax=Marixanthomonas ophiurae TaxID=387659 RepID=A0A3E1Q7R7_9FLAO|nr:hypothetical protein [Marixanthomonas ophiurae]RFN58175.1 hypothetical protein DZ858_13155 [Marixanthomonas ophiurae]